MTPRRPRIVVTNRVFPETRALLARFAEADINDGPDPWPEAELRRRAAEAEGLIAFMTDHIDEAFLAACPRLEAIACALKGANNIDLAAAKARGIAVSVVPDLLTAPTAELAVGLLIALGRNLLEGDRMVREGRFFGWRPILYGWGIDGATVGILGLGRVGRAIAERLAPFGCRLVGHDPAAAPPPGVTALSFAQLLAEADALILALPLTGSTRGLIGRDALTHTKPGALLVNVARGSLVDEEAVAEALEAGRLGGYAADVFAFEDWALPDRPRAIPERLLRHPATVFTPHLGSAVVSVRRAIEREAVEALAAHFAGRPMPGLITPS
ncbi:MAG: NAD(P)-dependent oxidoreductase [Acetobacteraceae bacterium]|nr:NAD(P)-dependent oxidoreductase [Acetobacteraceae bacterium]